MCSAARACHALRRCRNTAGSCRTRPTFRGWFRALPAARSYEQQLNRMLRRLQPDILHSNGLKMHFLTLWSRPRQSKVIWHIHDFLSRPANDGSCTPPHGATLFRSHCHIGTSAPRPERDMPGTSHADSSILSILTNFGPMVRHAISIRCPGLQPSDNVIRIGLVATMARWKGKSSFWKLWAKYVPAFE